MKISVVGMGSIGKRHYENLKSLKVDVDGYDIGFKPDYSVDCAFICTPTNIHFEIAKEFNDRNIPVLIEKPVCDSVQDLNKFDSVKWNKSSMVACNLRFTDTIQLSKSMKIKNLDCEISTNNKSLKYGDIALEDIHEFDCIDYLVGIESIDFINKSCFSYDALCFTKVGISHVHGDRLSNSYKRSVNSNDIIIDNNMYVREATYFLDCVKKNKQSFNTVENASKLTRKLLNAINRCNYTSSSIRN